MYYADTLHEKALVKILFVDDSFLLEEVFEAFALLDHVDQEEIDFIIQRSRVLRI